MLKLIEVRRTENIQPDQVKVHIEDSYFLNMMLSAVHSNSN